MNLVGKIFTVLILVMSLIFMAFVVAVYSTHTNWRDKVMNPESGYAKKLADATTTNQGLKDELDKLQAELATEQADRRQTLAKLENEKELLERKSKDQEIELARLKQDVREATAAMEAEHKTLESLRVEILGGQGPDGKQVIGLRKEIEQARAVREEQFAKVVELTDKLHQAVNEVKALQKRNKELAADYADALEVLRKHDLEPNPALYKEVPPRVEGVVLALQSGGLLEIDIGADDGLLEGHKLEVVRKGGTPYLGRIEVTDVSPDRAVAKIVPQFQKGAIQVGDDVLSRLK